MTDQELADAIRNHPSLGGEFATYSDYETRHHDVLGTCLANFLEDHPPPPEIKPGMRCIHKMPGGDEYDVLVIEHSHATEQWLVVADIDIYPTDPDELTPIKETP